MRDADYVGEEGGTEGECCFNLKYLPPRWPTGLYICGCVVFGEGQTFAIWL